MNYQDIETQAHEALERESKATKGKWRYTIKDCHYFMNSEFIDREGDEQGVGLVTCDINQDNATLYATDDDMEFIAHSRTDVPELARGVLELLEKNRELESLLSTYRMGAISSDPTRGNV